MRRLTCNNSMAYLKNWIDNFFQIFFMGTSWVAVSINNIKTRASSEMMSRKNIKSCDFNGVDVAKHWHVAGRGICHLWLPCFNYFHVLACLRPRDQFSRKREKICPYLVGWVIYCKVLYIFSVSLGSWNIHSKYVMYMYNHNHKLSISSSISAAPA